MRTVLPDPPQPLECVGPQHPHGLADADALPTVGAVTRPFVAEDVVHDLREERGPNVFLARWERYAWQRGDGEVEVIPVSGYQVVIVSDGPDCGPVTPSFINGIPVTEVRGPVDEFALRLAIRPLRD
jgi:hypothetical protein